MEQHAYVVSLNCCHLLLNSKKNKIESDYKDCTFATPDWHAYGHVASCQVICFGQLTEICFGQLTDEQSNHQYEIYPTCCCRFLIYIYK